MLQPHECFTAPISSAAEMTLVFPRNTYEAKVLIVPNEDKLFAICLEASQIPIFDAFECETNDHWNGLHIPRVRFEIDETSIFKSHQYEPLGSLVRYEDKLAARVNIARQGFRAGGVSLTLLSNLPSCAANQTACFLKWQIVLGEGDDKRILHEVDVTQLKPE